VLEKVPLSDLGRCWVAGRGLDDGLKSALRQSLFALQDPVVFDKLEANTVGFKMPGGEALNQLHLIIEGAAAFYP
jgi:hypothetical protein